MPQLLGQHENDANRCAETQPVSAQPHRPPIGPGFGFMRIGPLRSTQYSSSRRVVRIPLYTSVLNIPTLNGNQAANPHVVRIPTTIAFDNSGVMLSQLQALIAELRHSYDISPSQPQYTEIVAHRKLSKTVQDVIERTQLAPMYTSTSRILLSGQNNSQISNLYLSRFDSASQKLIQGVIAAAAHGASASIVGDALGKFTEKATYELMTQDGDYLFNIHEGEDLQTAADRLNADRHATRIGASVINKRLALTTDDVGSAASLQLRRLDHSRPKISGVNAVQLANVRVLAQAAGAIETISGKVLSKWSAARLTYLGTTDAKVAGTVSFRLSGSAGSALVTINKGESLADVANRLNRQAANTGVIVTLDNNALQFTSALQGAQSTVQISDIQRANQTIVSGVNSQQATSFAVDSFQPSSRESLAGDVVRSAAKATLTLQGSDSATVISTATFEVQGARGSTNITINAGEQLSAAAARINDVTGITGVTARVQGNLLVFESTTSGGAARIGVHLIDLPFTTTVNGGNNQQLVSFSADSFTAASSRPFSGNVTQAAGEAEISHHGSILGVGSSSNFTLTGALGSQSFNTTSFQSLNNLATQVNQQTAQTGVTATVSGTNIYFRSIKVGSDSQIRLVVNSGDFSTTGANAHGVASGTDAKAIINGQNLVASGNHFAFTDDLGSYRFTVRASFTGAISPVIVTGSTESFQLSGADAFGNAYGLNARAIVNGEQYDGNVNSFQIATSTGNYRVSFAQGFVGPFDPIEIQSAYDDFDVAGGDGNGNANGTDFVADINGQQIVGNDQTIRYASSVGRYDLIFNDDFLGAFDPIQIATNAAPILAGLDSQDTASGSDARATINGQDLIAVGNRFTYSDADMDLQFDANASFVGPIDPISIGYETVDPADQPPLSSSATNDHSGAQPAVPRNSQTILGEISSLLAAKRDDNQAFDKPDNNKKSASESTAGMSVAQIVARAQTLANLYRTLSQGNLLGDSNPLSQLLDPNNASPESSLNQFA